jgi:hypothetical protein
MLMSWFINSRRLKKAIPVKSLYKTQAGYGLALVSILIVTTMVSALSIQTTLNQMTPRLQKNIAGKSIARSSAIASFDAIRTQLQTQLNNGTAINVGYTWSSSISTPDDPTNLAGASTVTGSYTATVTKKGGNYYWVSVTATNNGINDTETRLFELQPGLRDIRLIGRTANDRFGQSVHSAGDVDGDGYTDFIMTAAEADDGGSNSGEAYLIFGRSQLDWNNLSGVSQSFNMTSLNGVDTGDNNIIRFVGEAANDYYSMTAPAGDVNADGFADFMISSWGANTNTGTVQLVFGRSRSQWNALTDSAGRFNLTSSNGVNTGDNNIIRFTGETINNYMSYLSKAGDVDNDGYEDLLIGATGGGINYKGSTYLIFGRSAAAWNTLVTDPGGTFSLASANGVNTGDNNIIRFNGRSDWDQAGRRPGHAGDMNADGFSDFTIAARLADGGGIDSGEVYLIFGRNKTNWNSITDAAGNFSLANTNGVSVGDNNMIRFIGRAAGDSTGSIVAGASDLNGDNIPDLLLSANGADSNGVDSGSAYLIFGRSLSGWSSLTDPNGDIQLSAAVVNGVNAGDNNMLRFVGRAAGDSLGSSVQATGDANGDGVPDFLLAADLADGGGVDSGEAYLIFGRSQTEWNTLSDVNGDIAMTSINGVNIGDNNMLRFVGRAAGDTTGRSFRYAGDVNNDGKADLICSGEFANSNGTDSGEAYLLFGRPLNGWNNLSDASGNITLLTLLP